MTYSIVMEGGQSISIFLVMTGVLVGATQATIGRTWSVLLLLLSLIDALEMAGLPQTAFSFLTRVMGLS